MTTFLSATQLETFDGESPFGCERKWHLQYVQRLPAPEVPHLKLGTELHSLIENYLLHENHNVPASSGAHMLFLAIKDNVDLVKQLGVMAVEHTMTYEPTELPDVTFRGKIDLVVGNLSTGLVGVVDWKTTSDLTKYAKKHRELASNIQLALYSRYLMEQHKKDEITVALVYVQTKGNAKSKVVSSVVTKKEVDETFSEVIKPRALRMVQASKDKDHSALAFPSNRWKCKNCPFNNICEKGKDMSGFLDELLGESAPDLKPTAPETKEQALAPAPVAIIPPEAEAIRKRGRPKKDSEPAPVPAGTKITKVTVTHWLTLNLGQYNSARVDVALEAETDDADKTLRELEERCKEELKRQLDTYAKMK